MGVDQPLGEGVEVAVEIPAGQRRLVVDLGDRRAELVGDGLEHPPSHPAVAGQLAAGDRQDPERPEQQLVAARQLRGVLLGRVGDQRAQAGPGPGDVLAPDRPAGEVAGDGLEQVVDVLGVDRRPDLRAGLVGGVGGADVDHVAAAEGEQPPLVLGVEDQEVADRQLGRRDRDVDALAEVQERLGLGVLEPLDGLDPRARGVDDDPPADGELLLAGLAADLDAGRPLARAQQPDARRVVEHPGPGHRRRADVGEDQAGVVGQVLAVGERVGELLAVEGRLLVAEGRAGPRAVDVLGLDRAEPLVGGDREPEAVEHRPPGHRHDHPARLRQVRRGPVDLLALERGLAHEVDLAALEVAEPAVDQLRRAARGPRREVGGLEQRDREPALGRVAGQAGAGDATADDDEVEALAGQSRAGLRTGEGRDAAAHPRTSAICASRNSFSAGSPTVIRK